MPWSNDATNLIVLLATPPGYSGLFAYSGAPGPGTLIMSEAAAAGTDPYGNAYLSGNTTYRQVGSIWFASSNLGGGFAFWTAPGYGGPWTSVAGIGLAGSSGNLLFLSAAPGAASPGLLISPNGTISASLPGSVAVEVWHTFALLNSFTAGTDVNGTAYPPSYKLLPNGDVALRGTLVTPGGGGVTGLPFGAVPAAYRPAVNVPQATIANFAGGQVGAVYIRPNGNAEISGGFGNGATIHIDGIIPVAGT
jgi:hypothetical protein